MYQCNVFNIKSVNFLLKKKQHYSVPQDIDSVLDTKEGIISYEIRLDIAESISTLGKVSSGIGCSFV